MRPIRSCTDGEKMTNGEEEEDSKIGASKGLPGERQKNTIVFDTPAKTSNRDKREMTSKTKRRRGNQNASRMNGEVEETVRLHTQHPSRVPSSLNPLFPFGEKDYV